MPGLAGRLIEIIFLIKLIGNAFTKNESFKNIFPFFLGKFISNGYEKRYFTNQYFPLKKIDFPTSLRTDFSFNYRK